MVELKSNCGGCVELDVDGGDSDIFEISALGESEYGGYVIEATREDMIKFLEDSIKFIKQQNNEKSI